MAKRPSLRKRQKKKRGLSIFLAIAAVAVLAGIWKVTGDVGVMEKMSAFLSSQSQLLEHNDTVRGTLYDRNYKKLAISLERVSIYARTREIKSVKDTAAGLASATGVDEGALLKKLKADDLRVWLVKDITQDQEDAVRQLNLPGIYLHKEHSRYYPQKLVAAHLIGFVQDDIGLAGAEFYYDRLVQKMLAEVDGGKHRIGAGQHVLLTLDLKVQAILESVVEQVVVGRQDPKVGAYAMDAGTGAIIAAVQYPSFNPNTYRIYSQQVLQNLLVEPMLLPPAYRKILKTSAEIQNQYESRGAVHPWSISAGNASLGSELRLWEKVGMGDGTPPDFGNSDKKRGAHSGFFIVPDQAGNDFGTVPEQLSPLALLTTMGSLLNGGSKKVPYLAQAVVDSVSGREYQLRPEAVEENNKAVVSAEASREIANLVASLGVRDELGGVIIKDSVQVSTNSRAGYGYLKNELYLSTLPAERSELVILLTIQGGSRNIPMKPVEKVIDPMKAIGRVLPRVAVLQQVGKSIAGVAEPEQVENKNYPVGLDKLRDAVRKSLEDDLAVEHDPGNMPALVGLSLRKSLRLLQNSPCEIRVFGTGRVVAQTPAAGASLAGVKECVIRLQRQADVSLEALEEKLSGRE